MQSHNYTLEMENALIFNRDEDSINLKEVIKLIVYQKYLNLSNDFLKSVIDFARRNAHPVSVNHNNKIKTEKRVCLKCFKAYIFAKAKEEGISNEAISRILIRGTISEISHGGYYLDGEKLVNILN